MTKTPRRSAAPASKATSSERSQSPSARVGGATTRYSRPPIIEAICEFSFLPEQEWDLTIPGLFYSKVKGQFPKKRERQIVEVRGRPGPNEPLTEQTTTYRVHFIRDDEKALIQVGPDYLAINHLEPYPGWEKFRSIAGDALRNYTQVAKPRKIATTSLRYINRIKIPTDSIEIEDYLRAVPRTPEELPQVYAGWIQRTDLLYPELDSLLKLQCGSLNAPDNTFLIDLQLQRRPGEFDPSDSLRWIDKGHEEVRRAFEACITDTTRSLFSEE